MEITPPPPPKMPLLALAKGQGGGDLSFLKPGQLFSAKVVGQGEDGTLEISLNDRLLRVLSDRQLMEGTKISVKVELKEGQTVLRLLDPLGPSTYSIQNALRQVMPKQQPLQPLFEQLARIALSRMPDLSATTTDAAPTPHASAESEGFAATLPIPLPPLVEQAIASLISQLPSRESVTHPDRLKGVIENSGLFLESRILGSDSGGDEPSQKAADEQQGAMQQQVMFEVMGKLDERSRAIIRRRWLDEEKATFKELSEEYGISIERIRQIEAAAFDRMRRRLQWLR